ncbi:SHOCT domain-containing protein [Mycobacterium sp. MMS18-G62]
MSRQRTAARVLVGLSILTLVVGIVGFIATLVLNAFVLDEYDAYGEVPVPGSTSLHLPAGEVTVSFHTQVIGSTSGGGLPVPELKMRLIPPDGVADPAVTENFGSTTTVNNDAHVRVWVVQVPAEGTYGVKTDGQINGYINPTLAFGHGSSYGWLVWVFVALFVFGVVDLVASLLWSARSSKKARPLAPQELLAVDHPAWSTGPTATYTPTDQGARLEQLKTLASLRDSGALTEAEFEAEKRRILGD